MSEKDEKKTYKAYSLYDQPKTADNPNWYKKTISGNRLGYDDHGKVVVKQLPEIEFQKQIDSYYDDYCLAEQIRKAQTGIANGESYEGSAFGDVSEMPADSVELMKAMKKNAAEIETLKQQLGTETSEKAIAAKNEKELEELVTKIIKEKIEKTAQNANENKEDK